MGERGLCAGLRGSPQQAQGAFQRVDAPCTFGAFPIAANGRDQNRRALCCLGQLVNDKMSATVFGIEPEQHFVALESEALSQGGLCAAGVYSLVGPECLANHVYFDLIHRNLT